MDKEEMILKTINLDADFVGLAEKVLSKQGMSVEEYLTDALKRLYVTNTIPFNPELTYDEEKRLLRDEEFDYQNEHGIDLTNEQKLSDWWSDTDEDYE